MSRTARLWKGAGLLTLGGVLLSGVVARGDDGPPLATQLNDLGRQALAQGASADGPDVLPEGLAARSRQRRGHPGAEGQQGGARQPAPRGLPGACPASAADRPRPRLRPPQPRRRPRHRAGQPAPGVPVVPARPRGHRQPRRRPAPRSRRASRKRTSPASSLPATSSSGSRRLATRSPRVSPRPR